MDEQRALYLTYYPEAAVVRLLLKMGEPDKGYHYESVIYSMVDPSNLASPLFRLVEHRAPDGKVLAIEVEARGDVLADVIEMAGQRPQPPNAGNYAGRRYAVH